MVKNNFSVILGESKLKEMADYALEISKAEQTEVIITAYNRNLTRFANSFIHQNTDIENIDAQIRVINDKKIGVASGNVTGKEDLKKILDQADLIASYQKPDPNFKSLPSKKTYPEVHAYSEETAKIKPLEKANIVKEMVDYVASKDLIASGAFDTSVSEIAIANSLGVWAYRPETIALLSLIVMGDNSSGFAKEANTNVLKIDYTEMAKVACDKAIMSKNPQDLEPGEYEVILEEEAVGEMLGYMAYMGFGAKVFHEDRSFMSGKLDQKVMGDNITIKDDPFNSRGVPANFDYEGYPKQIATLIDKGTATSVVYDSYTAHDYSQKNTGNALPAPNTLGPIPLNLILEPGKGSKEEMIKKVKRGILVTRFHYVNAHHYKILNITGMTRDGTFLIENGKIVGGIKNLRFTQSVPEALSNVLEIGKDLKLVENIGNILAPALRISKFNFTSKTEF
ncbi:MAG: Peptidase U62 modulator of DNA gyrase [candidate division CPR2 bacterium GW2011_GWC1_39_9]|uniref:Peptidase U62 modulator of DNA gyrase n=1 Tax=candidate division CPR2 bacterium GW2011_GWC2_39_10 TaxID=1618345 RepID=A0A0G0P723_UNCC2|nr:MAG: Peptidase U62 modulator of DNA gyrase [candidate division CPR2 bacterium GW2011_GWC2_39_10]KKR35924.1 MAG: Peptidase U62 modulator of DNA gyrase [candidate division CPR2 bacterium GW2011_GWC1_39_9]